MNLLCRPLVPLLLLCLFPCLPAARGGEPASQLDQPNPHVRQLGDGVFVLAPPVWDAETKSAVLSIEQYAEARRGVHSMEQVEARLEDFKKTKDMSQLFIAMQWVNHMGLSVARPPAAGFQARREHTRTWLKLFAVVEENQDPKFDWRDAAMVRSFPLQQRVRWLKGFNVIWFKEFLDEHYTSSAEDQKELEKLVAESGVPKALMERVKARVDLQSLMDLGAPAR